MTGPALAAINARMNSSSIDDSWHEGKITTYAGVVNHVIRRYATDAVIAKVIDSIRNFKQGSLTSWAFLQTSLDLEL